MITVAHVAFPVYSAWLGHLMVLAWPGWTHYAVTAWRAVMAHYRVLVALVEHRRFERQEFERSDIAHPETLTWDRKTLSGFRPVRVPEQAVDDAAPTGRHSKGEAAA